MAEESNRESKSEAEQAGILVWGRVTGMIAEALTPLLIVRMLGKADVGAFAALMLIYTTVAVLLTAGLPNSILYFLADSNRGSRRATMTAFNRLSLVLAVLMAALMVSLGYFGPDLLRELGQQLGARYEPGEGVASDLHLLPILGVFAFFDFPTRLLPNLLLAEGRPKASAGIGVTRSIAVTIGTLVPAALGYGVAGILVGTTIVGAGHAIVYVTIVRHLYKGTLPEAGGITARAIMAYCLPLGASQVTNTLNASLDQWLIVTLYPAERVAIYKSGAYQIPLLTTIAYTLASVYLPRFTRLFREGKAHEALAIWRASVLKVSLVVVPASLVFIVGSEEFCVLAFTSEYADTAGVFRAYCFLVLARVTAYGPVLLAAGRPGFVMRSSALTLAANAVISIPLTYWIGFYGPAIGTALAFIPTMWFYNHYLARATGVPITQTFPMIGYMRVLAVAGVPTAVAIAFKLLVHAHPALMFTGEAVIIMAGWAWLGTWTGLIGAEDWVYVRRWLRLDVMR